MRRKIGIDMDMDPDIDDGFCTDAVYGCFCSRYICLSLYPVLAMFRPLCVTMLLCFFLSVLLCGHIYIPIYIYRYVDIYRYIYIKLYVYTDVDTEEMCAMSGKIHSHTQLLIDCKLDKI